MAVNQKIRCMAAKGMLIGLDACVLRKAKWAGFGLLACNPRCARFDMVREPEPREEPEPEKRVLRKWVQPSRAKELSMVGTEQRAALRAQVRAAREQRLKGGA